MKKAIAYVKSEVLDQKNTQLRSYQAQENSIRNYCIENNLELVRVFRDADESVNPMEVLAQIVLYLSKDMYGTDYLIVNSFTDLKNNFDRFSKAVTVYWDNHKVKVICLYEKFIEKIISGIKKYPAGLVQKQMSECIIRFLLSFKSRNITFTIHDLYVFGAIRLPAMKQQPPDPELPADLNILFELWEEMNPDIDYRQEYLLLVDSIMKLYLSRDLMFFNNPDYENYTDDLKLTEVTGQYKVLSSCVSSETETDFLEKSYSVVLSNAFWNDFQSLT